MQTNFDSATKPVSSASADNLLTLGEDSRAAETSQRVKPVAVEVPLISLPDEPSRRYRRVPKPLSQRTLSVDALGEFQSFRLPRADRLATRSYPPSLPTPSTYTGTLGRGASLSAAIALQDKSSLRKKRSSLLGLWPFSKGKKSSGETTQATDHVRTGHARTDYIRTDYMRNKEKLLADIRNLDPYSKELSDRLLENIQFTSSNYTREVGLTSSANIGGQGLLLK
ncbi:hypothetical protein, partial [Sansalvadorimonas verongulae]|uniref:hypothetical protein n=1 Tax=Sansalvadorimonas verongulae TaxID=2172824 RepID=UPI0012BD4148